MTYTFGLDTFGDRNADADGKPLSHAQTIRNVAEEGVVAVAVTEGVEPEGVCHIRLPASWRTARSNSGSVSTAPNTGPPG